MCIINIYIYIYILESRAALRAASILSRSPPGYFEQAQLQSFWMHKYSAPACLPDEISSGCSKCMINETLFQQ